MLTAFVVAYEFPHKLIVAPIYIIILAVALAVLVKKPSLKWQVGGFLFVAGIGEIHISLSLMFSQGFWLGLATWVIGVMSILLSRARFLKNR